jgi:DNA processing protein
MLRNGNRTTSHNSRYLTCLELGAYETMGQTKLLYYRGWWDLVEAPSVAVVGTRNPSPEGIERAATVARRLVEYGYTVVSGLAAGVDATAHKSAIDAGGKTIAVIGTPINRNYPKEN